MLDIQRRKILMSATWRKCRSAYPSSSLKLRVALTSSQGLLDYLDDIEDSSDGSEEDLVLIVDGYDVWFQLHRDVLLRRYYVANEAADNRTRQMFGDQLFKEHDMRQTIIFGPDKICWPIDLSRPACWAIPESSLPEMAFGPRTDEGREDFNQPRWLNSGTVMGPAKDIRDLLRATETEIHANYITDSDQFYLAEIFGGQSYARLEKKPELIREFKNIRYGQEHHFKEEDLHRRLPNLTVERREYHIGIDYESSLFQTLAFYKMWLTWSRTTDSWSLHADDITEKQYSIQLPVDISASPAPFSAFESWQGPVNATANSKWEDVELLYNTASEQIPPMVHLAGGPDEKRHRGLWWQKLWFQAYSEELRLASIEASAARLAREASSHPSEVIGGYRWRNAEPPEAQDVQKHGLGGAFADIAGGWFSWRGLCGAHEADIFRISNDEIFHPPPKAPD
jgi:hypothetical protein